MLHYIYEYGWIIAVIIIAGLYYYNVYRKKGKAAMIAEIKTTVFQLMLLAEKQFGQGNGGNKFDWLVDRLYEVLPDTAKIFITRDMAKKYIQKWYEELKKYLKDGELKGSSIVTPKTS